MSDKFDEKFENFFKELEGMGDSKSIPKMEGLVHNALGFFEFIREKLSSDNEEEKKEALELAQKMQEKLLEQTEKALKASGMTEEQLKGFLNQPLNFNEEELKSFQNAQKEIQDYQNTLFKTSVPKVEGVKNAAMGPKKPKKGKEDWIPG